MEKWFDVPEKEGSSVICSRVRLVRNWREYPFPGKMTKEQSVEMTGRLMNGVKESGAFSGSRSRYLYLDRIPDLERTALLERRAISRGVSKKKAAAGLVLSEDERLGITINGDDHIRIQAVEKGAALTECYRRADQMEEELNAMVDQGCTVLDVIVEHPIYGQLTGQLQISNRYDVGQFVQRCRRQEAAPLSQLTEGIHLHTVACPSQEAYGRVKESLSKLGFLLEEK